MEIVEIKTETIRLDQAMKLSGHVESGAMAKWLVQEKRVMVNEKPCLMRGKKLRSGDRVSFESICFIVRQSGDASEKEEIF